VVTDLACQDPPGGDVVSKAEAAWNTKDLEGVHDRGLFNQAIDMNTPRDGTSPRKGVGRLFIAVRSRGTQYESLGWHLTVFLLK
jgi:hypothetical protein